MAKVRENGLFSRACAAYCFILSVSIANSNSRIDNAGDNVRLLMVIASELKLALRSCLQAVRTVPPGRMPSRRDGTNVAQHLQCWEMWQQ